MSTWKEYYISELCSDIIDCINKTAPLSSTETPYRMLRTSDVRNGYINTENLNCVSKEVFEKWTRRGKLQIGDIVFTREAPLGEAGIVREAENYFLGQRLVLYRVNPKVCDSRFLLYWFLNPMNKEALKKRGIGSTVTHLRVPECMRLKVTVPDIAVQIRIANILWAFDSLIYNNEKQIKLLEEAARRLYREWFVDLHFPGYEKSLITNGIPRGWKKEHASSLLTVSRGKSYSSAELSAEEGILLINLSNIQAYGGYNRQQEKRFSGKYKEGQLVCANDLIMGVTDMTQERRTVGRVALIPKLHEKAIISMDLIKLEPHNGSTLFYYAMFRYGDYGELISRFANGTNVLHLRPEALSRIEVLMPTIEIQDRYTQEFSLIQEQINVLQDQIISATEARDRLLPKFMSGEIEL